MSTAQDLLAEVGAILGLAAVIVIALVAMVALRSLRNQRSVAGWVASQRDAADELRDANAQVILELETHPATYETFPQQVRDAVYAAAESARVLNSGRKR